MKILILSSENPSHPKSGLGVHLSRLIPLIEPHAELYVCAPDGCHTSPIHIHLPVSTNFLSYADFESAMADVNAQMIKHVMDGKWRYDLIHAHDDITAPAARYLKNKLNIPLLTTIHGLESSRKQVVQQTPHPYRQLTECILIEASDRIILLSTFMKSFLERAYGAGKKAIVIPSPITQEHISSSRVKTINKPYLFSFGRFVPEKGFHHLIQVFSLLKKRHPGLKLVLAGEGPSLASYTKQAETLGLKQSVVFLPFLSQAEKQGWLSRCELAVFPSLYEPFGLAAQESMERGVPTVVSNKGGWLDYAHHNKTAFVADFTQETEAAETINGLLIDRKRLSRVKEKGRDHIVRLHHPAYIKRAYLTLYEQMLNKSAFH
ncbi:glycosyltransferase family 4 protein [Bacillus atrophaeus]|uniref:glycosyltransferase family 4 protein n=1 Tax=Bacillus atrophaeus TaxID=1452 RepID=UPI0031BB5D38